LFKESSNRRPMLFVRNQAAITRLLDGRVMVSGGYGEFFIAETDVHIGGRRARRYRCVALRAEDIPVFPTEKPAG
jgi:hypothetical protein